MNKLTAMAIIAVAAVAMSSSDASAQQHFQNGYQFGVGVNQSRCGGGVRTINQGGFLNFGRIGFSPRVEEPPYFAKFPPVYYSGIVARPYGISPYAAPPGITPVEMTIAAPKPVTIKNPHFKTSPVVDTTVPKSVVDGQSTWVKNPYQGSQVSN